MSKLAWFRDQRAFLLGRSIEQIVELAARNKRHLSSMQAQRALGVMTPALVDPLRAPAYVVSRPICGMVLDVLPQLPSFDVTRDLLPTSDGFMALDGALYKIMPDGESLIGGFEGFAWTVRDDKLHMASFSPSGIGAGYEPLPWKWSPDGPLRVLNGAPDNDTEEIVRLEMAVFVGLVAFMQQRLVVEPKAVHPDRADRRRRTSEPLPDLVTEYILRRITSRSGEERSVDWRHRWIVRGHWRQQPYGKGRAFRRPQFIPPHIKGPPDAPLKPITERLIRIER